MYLIAIKEALSYGGMVKRKPSLFPEARDPQKWDEVKNAPFYQTILQELRMETAGFLRQPLPVLPYSLFKLFRETGSRKEYEAIYFARRARLNNLALLALIDGDYQCLKALEDTIWAICDEYTWCLPAHLQGGEAYPDCNASTDPKQGILTQTLRPPEKTVDLFAAETGFALAEILSLLEGRLAPEVVRRGRNEVFRRVLEPYQQLNPLFWWETAPMNWAAVCAGSVGAAALYLITDEAVLAPLLQRVLETLEVYLAGFGDDGACTEGIGYWTYGFGFYVYFASLLRDRTAGKLNLFAQEKIAAIALFQQKCYLTANYVVSFSDAGVTQNYQLGLTHFLKRIYPELQVPGHRYQARFAEDHCRRWAHAVRDLIWANPDVKAGLDQADTKYFKDAQWLIAKQADRGKLICFVAKGGHNDEPHNHNDIGSFLLHVAGETLLADLGRGEYTRQYFQEARRYQFLCTSSRGHSVPVIEGEYQKAGPEFAAVQVTVEATPDESRMRMELAGAYGVSNLQSLVRQFVFAKGDYPQLRLTDHFQFAQIPSTVTERFISECRPELIVPGRVRIKGKNCSVDLVFTPELMQCRMRQERMITHESTNKEVYLIDLEISSVKTEFSVAIDFEIKLEISHETNQR